MKFRKLILPTSIVGTIIPVAAVVSCGGTTVDTKNDNFQIADDLNKELKDLQSQLTDTQNQAKSIQTSDDAALDYKNKIEDLNNQITNLKKEISDAAKVSVIEVKKEKTIVEKIANFQAFQLLHASEFSTMTFDELKSTLDPKLPMPRGIESFSLAQTASYLENLAIKLGFKEVDTSIDNVDQKPLADSKLESKRLEAFNQAKTITDNLKAMTNDARDLVLDRDTYTRFATLYSIGNAMSTQLFDQSGIDTSSFGQLIPKAVDKSNTAYIYPNFNFKTQDNKEVQLFSPQPWVADGDTSYDNPKIFGTQRIDADKPGSVITTLDFGPSFIEQAKNDGTFESVQIVPAFSKEIEVEGLSNVYPIASNEDRIHNLNILEAIVRKMSVVFASENADKTISLRKNAAKNNVSQRLIDALEYLGSKFESVNDGYTIDEVKQAYDELNNGSHYFKSIEVFARGLSGIVFSKPAKGGDLYLGYTEDASASYKGIIDMAFDHLEGTLLPWGTYQGNGLYTIESGKFSWTLDFRDYKPENI